MSPGRKTMAADTESSPLLRRGRVKLPTYQDAGPPRQSGGRSIVSFNDCDQIIPGRVSASPETTVRTSSNQGLISRRASSWLKKNLRPFQWIPEYSWSYVKGDAIAALTVASVYIPATLSLASDLAHISELNGLYSFIIIPFIYGLFGSAYQMVVGPEATGSLLTGLLVNRSINENWNTGTMAEKTQLVGVSTMLVGCLLLAAGILKLGILDNILSRPFMRGFVGSAGVMIFIDQVVPELGLSSRSANDPVFSGGGFLGKLQFLMNNLSQAHVLTATISIISFFFIMVFRWLRMSQKGKTSLVNFPDQFFLLVTITLLVWGLRLDTKGVAIVGAAEDSENDGQQSSAFLWPLRSESWKDVPKLLSTTGYLALIGMFETSVSAKALAQVDAPGIRSDGFQTNTDMVVLGVANFFSGCFMGLPGFGGYGRSKMSVLCGGRTPMVNIFLGLITAITVFLLVPLLYYLPKAVLCSMNSAVAWSLMEELPKDFKILIRLHAWKDIAITVLVFLTAVFIGPTFGIGVGIGCSLFDMVNHSSNSRAQASFQRPTPASSHTVGLERTASKSMDSLAVIQVSEPLTFANINDFQNKLRKYISPLSNNDQCAEDSSTYSDYVRGIIIDISTMPSLDNAAVLEILDMAKSCQNYGIVVSIVFNDSKASEDVMKKLYESGVMDLCDGFKNMVGEPDHASARPLVL